MRLWPITLLGAATGCAQLFGIDVTSAPDAPSGDRVSVTMRRVSIGASVVEGSLDMTGQSAKFLVDDGTGVFTAVDGVLGPMDTFAAPILTGTPPVLFTGPDMIARLWATPARAQRGSFAVFEHPNPLEPLPSSQIAISAMLPTAYAASESFKVEAIGAWMQRPLTGASELPLVGANMVSTTIPYSSFTQMTSSPKARIASSDVVVLLRYLGNQLTGVLQTQFDQTDAADPLGGMMSGLTPNLTLSATIDPAAYTTRYTAVRPTVTGLTMSWSVTAAPGWSVGASLGPRLHAGTSTMTDTSISAMYANPFESIDWRSVLAFTSSSGRTYTHMNIAVPLGASLLTVTEPGTTTLPLNLQAGLPSTIRANLVPLTTDGTDLPLDLGKAVEIDAILDRPTNTLYTMSLVELVVNGTAVERETIVEVVATEAKFRLPPELFQLDHYYYLTVRSYQGGYPGAATGDLQTVTLPYTIGALDSGVFKVVAP
jgi:hypothetical protein